MKESWEREAEQIDEYVSLRCPAVEVGNING
jgi:hypothetical protein